ncbi:hypothetical protein J1C67_19245 [Clostridium gasigenes]|uniref:hypothetical protein n=1 Tax=Clostridium gasigenes TaxID=94869 RepID=UPI0014385BC7|nr:hypothetical protein [Clostridium gasigenes]NKF08759.1 hypothetical protein [Clostridium gasigenes]QSW19626.1 hypothetical protein J1C67_19245 [Clostridium gasigenes]
MFIKEITKNKNTEAEIINIIMLRNNNNIKARKKIIDMPMVKLDSKVNSREKIKEIYSERVKLDYKEIKK